MPLAESGGAAVWIFTDECNTSEIFNITSEGAAATGVYEEPTGMSSKSD